MASDTIFIGPQQTITRRNSDISFQLFVVSKVTGTATITVTTIVVDGINIAPTISLIENIGVVLSGVLKSAGVYNITAAILNEDGDLETTEPVVVTCVQMASELDDSCVDTLDQDEWELPAAGQQNPAMFLGDKEKNFQKHIAQEISERITNETVLYYAVDVNNTYYHPLYGEALVKKFWPPVRLAALIEWKPQETKNEKFTLDRVPVIAVHMLKRRIEEDSGLNVMVGDFVFYGRDFYEIVSIENPTKLYGSPTQQVEIVMTCVKARQGTFYVENQDKLKIDGSVSYLIERGT